MADIYDRLRVTGRRLLNKYGRPAVWRQFRESGGRPYQPFNGHYVDFEVRVAILPNVKEGRATLDEGSNEQPIGQSIAYMGQVSFVPCSKDVLVIDGTQHRIINVRTYKPSTKDVLHVIELYE